jgi:hypothetical protein
MDAYSSVSLLQMLFNIFNVENHIPCREPFLAYVPYFEEIKVGLWDHVAVCVCPLSLLGNDSVKIPLSLLGNGSVKVPISLLGNGSVETLPR